MQSPRALAQDSECHLKTFGAWAYVARRVPAPPLRPGRDQADRIGRPPLARGGNLSTTFCIREEMPSEAFRFVWQRSPVGRNQRCFRIAPKTQRHEE